jgi:hypothetical protein
MRKVTILPGEGNQPFATVQPASQGAIDAAAASIKEATMAYHPIVTACFDVVDPDRGDNHLTVIVRDPQQHVVKAADMTAEQLTTWEQIRTGAFSITIDSNGRPRLAVFDH